MRNTTETTYTFRLPGALKTQAEEAAKILDVTIAQVLRKSLRLLVKQAQREPDWEYPGEATPSGLIVSSRAVAETVTRKPKNTVMQEAEILAARVRELESLEKKNMLNPPLRKELEMGRELLRRAACA